MSNVNGPKIPATFKSVLPFIRRAEELDRDTTRPESKLIAYFCRQYAMELGIQLRENDNSSEATEYLLALMDQLEDTKTQLPTFSQDEGQAICEDFAREIFAKADDEDRAGAADKNTARTFYAAGTFFDILNQFGNVSEDILEKRRYCKYKAATILKAIKEGVRPTPGPPSDNLSNVELDTSNGSMITPATPPTMQNSVGPTGFSTSPAKSPVRTEPSSMPPNSGVNNSHYAQNEQDIPFPSIVASAGSMGSYDGSYSNSDASYQSAYTSSSKMNQVPMPQPPTEPPRSVVSRKGVSTHTQNEINDAIEYAKFSIAALKVKDMDLAVERLEAALRCIKK